MNGLSIRVARAATMVAIGASMTGCRSCARSTNEADAGSRPRLVSADAGATTHRHDEAANGMGPRDAGERDASATLSIRPVGGESANADPALQTATPRVAVLADGTPLFGAIVRGQIVMRRFHENAWSDIGTAPLNTDPASALSIATHGDVLVAAWVEARGRNAPTVHASQWNGTAWQALGTIVNAPTARGVDWPRVAFDHDAPVVVWRQNGAEGQDVVPAEWDGHAWQSMSLERLNMSATRGVIALATATLSNDVPIVTWVERTAAAPQLRVMKWVPAQRAWAPLAQPGGVSVDADSTSLAIAGCGDGSIVLATAFSGGLDQPLRLADGGNAWVGMNLPDENLSHVGRIGGVDVTCAADGAATLVYQASRVFVARSAGAHWLPVLGPIDSTAGLGFEPRVASGTRGHAIVSYLDRTGDAYAVKVLEM